LDLGPIYKAIDVDLGKFMAVKILEQPIPLVVNFRNCATPVKTKLLLAKTKLLSVKFELGPLQICWKFSDL
jgi:hypothetical protein